MRYLTNVKKTLTPPSKTNLYSNFSKFDSRTLKVQNMWKYLGQELQLQHCKKGQKVYKMALEPVTT